MNKKVESKKETIMSIDISTFLYELAENYDIDIVNQDEVIDYIRDNSDILHAIPIAINSARKYFTDGELTLEVYHDPEVDHSYLYINVRVSKYDDTVMERIDRAESEYLHLLNGKKGWIIMSTDFMTPQK